MKVKKEFIRFVLVFMAAHLVSYYFAGAVCSEFFTKPVWDNPDTLLSLVFRSPQEPDLWRSAMLWQVPGQILRSLVFGLALLPFAGTLEKWNFPRRFFVIFLLIFGIAHLSASAPSPANIEGLVFIKPEFIEAGFFRMQIEMILYGVGISLISSRFIFKLP